MDKQAEYQAPVMRSNWPMIFGILGIVFGIFGFLNAAYQIFWMGIMQKMGPSAFIPSVTTSTGSPGTAGAKEMEEAMNAAMGEMMAGMMEVGKTKIYADGALAILSVLLFAGGILLLTRYRISRILLLIWSYAKLVVGLYAVILTQKYFNVMGGSMGTMINEQMQNASGGSSAPPSMDMIRIYEIMGTVYLVLGSIWMAVLPVILMIWLNRQDIKDDIANGYGWK